MKFSYRTHNFKPVKIEGRIVLARCTCCRQPRFAVFLAMKYGREFYYHGFDETEARKTFNFLVQKQAQQAQIQ